MQDFYCYDLYDFLLNVATRINHILALTYYFIQEIVVSGNTFECQTQDISPPRVYRFDMAC